MRSERGADNIRRYNEERERRLLPLVEDELRLCRKRKLQFRSMGLLAAHISDRTKIHRTTLIRNPKYKVLLLAHISSQPGAAAIVDEASADPVVLRTKLTALQLQNSILNQEMNRLTRQRSLAERPSESHPGVDRSGVAFANVAMLLLLVLARVSETIVVDFDRRCLIDLAARPSDRLIADHERVDAFVSWLEQNQQLPTVKSIKRSNSLPN